MVFAGDPDAFDEAVLVREQRLADAAGQDRNVARLRGAAQPVDQLGAGAARQAVHAMRRMARIVEIGNHLERHVVGIRKPLDGRPCVRCDGLHQLRVGLAVRLAGNVFGEALRRILDAPLPLEARARRRDEAGRQSRRSAWHRVALDHHRLDAGFAGGERGAKACGTRADDQQRHFAVEVDVLGRSDVGHYAPRASEKCVMLTAYSFVIASGVCQARCCPPSITSVAPVTLRADARYTTASATSSAVGPCPSGTAAACRAKSSAA